jgi:hypothetical protein
MFGISCRLRQIARCTLIAPYTRKTRPTAPTRMAQTLFTDFIYARLAMQSQAISRRDSASLPRGNSTQPWCDQASPELRTTKWPLLSADGRYFCGTRRPTCHKIPDERESTSTCGRRGAHKPSVCQPGARDSGRDDRGTGAMHGRSTVVASEGPATANVRQGPPMCSRNWLSPASFSRTAYSVTIECRCRSVDSSRGRGRRTDGSLARELPQRGSHRSITSLR